ncbi:MAG TPA: hypothetical protein VIL49_16385 [Capillimicrobium sp.]|jgi:hypothetical protein
MNLDTLTGCERCGREPLPQQVGSWPSYTHGATMAIVCPDCLTHAEQDLWRDVARRLHRSGRFTRDTPVTAQA